MADTCCMYMYTHKNLLQIQYHVLHSTVINARASSPSVAAKREPALQRIRCYSFMLSITSKILELARHLQQMWQKWFQDGDILSILCTDLLRGCNICNMKHQQEVQ